MNYVHIALTQLALIGVTAGRVTAKPTPRLATSVQVNRVDSPAAQQARQTVIAFLTWYRTHLQAASQFELVNQEAGRPYSVNVKNTERYLAYLKSSHLLTDHYLNGWRTFFRERQAGFRQSPQTEGPPTGFDYDLVLLNQEVDLQLASLQSLKVQRVTVRNDRATVMFVLLDTYAFRLVRSANRWLIDEILNQSQE